MDTLDDTSCHKQRISLPHPRAGRHAGLVCTADRGIPRLLPPPSWFWGCRRSPLYYQYINDDVPHGIALVWVFLFLFLKFYHARRCSHRVWQGGQHIGYGSVVQALSVLSHRTWGWCYQCCKKHVHCLWPRPSESNGFVHGHSLILIPSLNPDLGDISPGEIVNALELGICSLMLSHPLVLIAVEDIAIINWHHLTIAWQGSGPLSSWCRWR